MPAPTIYRAMISSTAVDLAAEREAAFRACNAHDFLPKGMEIEQLRLETAEQVSKRMVDECDVYVLLLAHRYGSRPRRNRPSYTEIELRRARQLKKKIIVLQIDDDCLVRADSVETGDEAVEGLQRLHKLARAGGQLVKRFGQPADVAKWLAEGLEDARRRLDAEAPRQATGVSIRVDVPSAQAKLDDLDRIAQMVADRLRQGRAPPA